MSLARAHVWNVGDLLKSADLNGEFNNILLNPIALVSPTTGAINFNLQSHNNLLPSAITATSATAGQALISNGVSSGVVFGAPTVTGSGITVAVGTTGQVLAVTSSNSPAAFQVIPPDGGLSTSLPSTGMIYYISTAGLLTGLTVGALNQVLTVDANSKPSWATPSASGGVQFSSQFTYADDFQGYRDGTAAGGGLLATPQAQYWTNTAETFTFITSAPGGAARFPVNAAANTFGISASSGSGTPIYPFRASLNPDFTLIVAPNSTSTAIGWRMGLNGNSSAQTMSSDPADGLFWRTRMSSTVVAVVRSGGVETAVNTTAVMTSSFKPIVLRMQVTGGGTQVNIYTNGNLHSTAVTTNIPTTQLSISFGTSSAVANTMTFDGWSVIQDRNTSPF